MLPKFIMQKRKRTPEEEIWWYAKLISLGFAIFSAICFLIGFLIRFGYLSSPHQLTWELFWHGLGILGAFSSALGSFLGLIGARILGQLRPDLGELRQDLGQLRQEMHQDHSRMISLQERMLQLQERTIQLQERTIQLQERTLELLGNLAKILDRIEQRLAGAERDW